MPCTIIARLPPDLAPAGVRQAHVVVVVAAAAGFGPVTARGDGKLPTVPAGSFCQARGTWSRLALGSAADDGDLVGDGAGDVEEEVVDE